MTSHPGEEQNPSFSPDGKHIAFTASYDGNVDAYVIPTSGGEPTRLTWHPGDDIVRGFTPDGKVLFSSQRAVFSLRHAQFYTVGIGGGVPELLPIPNGDKGAISPDGKFLAYTPLGERFRQWKNYRGGTASRIWVLKLDDLSHEEVPKPAGGCNDTEPMWIGETIYFLSDRDGEFNLYSFDRSSKTVARCTHHDAFPIASASAGAGKVIYEQAGWIHQFDPVGRESHRLKIGVAADLTETRPRYASDSKHIRNVAISPSGKRAVVEYRGEIVTVPAKKGDAHVLTETPGAHARSPAWSPDGKSIAYFSDETGEYQLVVRPQDGKGSGRSYPIKRLRLLRAASVVARRQKARVHRQLAHALTGSTSTPGNQANRRRADLRTDPGSRARSTPGLPTRSGSPIHSSTAPAFRRSGSIRSMPTSRTP